MARATAPVVRGGNSSGPLSASVGFKVQDKMGAFLGVRRSYRVKYRGLASTLWSHGPAAYSQKGGGCVSNENCELVCTIRSL
jgi:hypothetical protein